MRIKKTYTESMQDVVQEYRDAGQPWPARSADIARWAIKNGRWVSGAHAMVKLCARDLARAMRDEYYTDAKGRRVRNKHAARFALGEDQSETLWGDIETAPPLFMEMAFKQRRQQIVGDCKQLKTDVESYNDYRKDATPIRMLWDFTDEIEASHPRTYEPTPLDPSIAAIVAGQPVSQSPSGAPSSDAKPELSHPADLQLARLRKPLKMPQPLRQPRKQP